MGPCRDAQDLVPKPVFGIPYCCISRSIKQPIPVVPRRVPGARRQWGTMCSFPSQTLNLLVINPNGSTTITKLIRSGIDRYIGPNTIPTYWTCPDGPAVLQSQEDIDKSTEACLEPLVQIQNRKTYDAFLLACYADHSLVAALQCHARMGSMPVVGIFEASVQYALDVLQPSKRFAILTTGKAYEEQLSSGVARILDSEDVPRFRFAGVVATGVGWSDLEQGRDGMGIDRKSVV